MKVEVIIVAGGLGQRMGAKIPKALMVLNSRPLVSYSLKVFNAHPSIKGIVIVGVKEHLKEFNRIAAKFKKVRAVVAGGKMRADSVKCGIQALNRDTEIVLVHDAARPLIDAQSISRLLKTLKKDKAAILGVPVKFTVKKVDAALNIKETPRRDLLWEAQTPQGFYKDILVKAHARPSKEEATDDAMLVERLGLKVKMVMGHYHNFKVTTPEDMQTAKNLL